MQSRALEEESPNSAFGKLASTRTDLLRHVRTYSEKTSTDTRARVYSDPDISFKL